MTQSFMISFRDSLKCQLQDKVVLNMLNNSVSFRSSAVLVLGLLPKELTPVFSFFLIAVRTDFETAAITHNS